MELFTKKEYQQSKRNDLLKSKCDWCGNIMKRTKKRFQENRAKGNKYHTCGSKCTTAINNKKRGYGSKIVKCKQCQTKFKKEFKEINKSPNHFCCRSCAATYNNTHKTHGYRRSKLEFWLEEQLPKLYPHLEFHWARKDAINGELDIYIPTLKLAFELNGIFHYEPIYGQKQLNKIQNNDQRKFAACHEKGIGLCTIDVSQLSYFKPSRAQKYLDIIIDIIDKKIN